MNKRDSLLDNCGSSARRQFIGDAGMAVAAALLPLGLASPARAAGNSYPSSDVRHYGVVPNNEAAAPANTAALTALVNPAGDFSGKLDFPNTTGEDVYYFSDVIPFHDGIHIDLMNSTLKFSKMGVARDTNAGFLHAIRNFSIENGTIVVDYTHMAGFNTGNALSFGGRGDDCALFRNLYDSLLATSMGKITVRNVRISSNAGGGEGRGILMLGGLDGVLLENVTIEGQGRLIQGVYYEFGWATNDPKLYLRQTSHAHNVQVRNLTVSGVIREGFSANGMYRAVIDGIKVVDSGGVCAFGSGESTFFRVWSGVPDRKSKPYIQIRNAIGQSIHNLGISVAGASKITNGFLDNPPAHDNPNGLRAEHQTDLMDFTLDTFSMTGTANNYGVSTSARRAVIRNGTLNGFQRGVVTTQECTKFLIEAVNVLDCTGIGIQIGQALSLHVPPRLASGIIRQCTVAGSGADKSSPAIAVGTTQSCVIENCRFGYDQSHDGKSERTQTQAVAASADALGVVCRYNSVGGIASNNVAYSLSGVPSAARQCRLISNSGIVTASGPWLSQLPPVQAIAGGGTLGTAGIHSVWVAAASPVSGVRLQPGSENGQAITVTNNGPAANFIKFGAAGSSNVEDGAQAIAGLSSRILIWNSDSKLWSSLN